MIYGSVCSGIEAATVAWHPLGWKAAFYAEIDKFPSAVLAHHYPSVPNFGDFTTIKPDQHNAIDILVGGTPCQSFSIAGLRGGLGDDRGNLALEYLRLADRARPRWLVWENVPGVLSSGGGRDFGAILGGMVELGYGIAYRVLDAQYVRVDGFWRAVPQRRRRVFVVGYLGDWRRAAAVLFERASLLGDSAPGRQAGESVTHDVASCIGASGRGFDRTRETRGQDPVVATGGRGGLAVNISNGEPRLADVTGTLDCWSMKGRGSSQQQAVLQQQQQPVAHVDVMPTLLPVAYRVHSDFSTAMTGNGSARVADPTDVARSLDTCGGYASAQGGNVVLHPHNDPGHGARSGDSKDEYIVPVYPIDTQNMTENHTSGGLGFGAQGDPSFTLTKGHSHAVAYDLRGREGGAQFEGPHDTANIRAASGGSSKSYVAASAVRRLTPRECERLQGFPDDYTLIPWRGKSAPDGPRYKALGNSMAVNVMRWIGQRIEMVEALDTSALAAE